MSYYWFTVHQRGYAGLRGIVVTNTDQALTTEAKDRIFSYFGIDRNNGHIEPLPQNKDKPPEEDREWYPFSLVNGAQVWLSETD